MKIFKTLPKRMLSVLLTLAMIMGLFAILPAISKLEVSALDYNFNGNVETIEGRTGAIYLRGWAYDALHTSTVCNIEVHVKSDNAYNAVMYTIRADKYRPDVDNSYHTGKYHGFEATIPVQNSGNAEVSVYVKNAGRSSSEPQNFANLCNSATFSIPSSKRYDDWYVYLNFQSGNNYSHSTLEAKTDGTYKTQIATPDYTNPNQLWHVKYSFTSDNHDYYTIQNVGTGEYLSTTNGTGGVSCGVTTSATAGNNAKWFFHPYGDNNNRINFFLLISYYYWDWNITVDGNDQNAMYLRRDGGAAGLIMMQRLLSVPDYTSVRIQNLTNPTTYATRYSSWLDYRSFGMNNSDYDGEIWELDQRSAASTSYGTVYAYWLKNKKTDEYLQYSSSSNSDSAGSVSWGSNTEQWLLIGDSIDSAQLVPVSGASRTYAWSHTPINQTIPCLTANDDIADQAKDARMFQIDGHISRYHKLVMAQQKVTGLSSFYSTIVPTNATSTALSLSLDGKSNGVVIRGLASDSPAADQQWYFQNVGNDMFVIRNLANNKVLFRASDGTLQFGDYVNDNSHKWFIAKEGTRSSYKYSIVSAYSTVGNYTIGATGTTDEKAAYITTNTDYLTFNLTTTNTTAPVYGEDLGDTFFAYICHANTDDCLYYDYSCSGNTIVTRTKEKKQENYWRFDRHPDGSYTITSCNMENQVAGLSNTSLSYNNTYVYSTTANSSDNGTMYSQRWFIRKYGGSYKLESKRNGKVFDLNGGSSLYYKTNTNSYTSSQMFDIIKTDMTVDTDMPNVKMHLFNYGNAINEASGAVLPFTGNPTADPSDPNGIKNAQPSVDGYSGDTISGITIPEYTGDHTVQMSRSLVNGYPYVRNNGETNLSGWNAKFGSLQYLFDPNMGNSNGFVQGGGSQNSYDTTASTVSYQSQHFDIESTKGMFKYNPNNGMYYYNSLLNSAYFQRSTDEQGNLKASGNFKLYDYTTSVPYPSYAYSNWEPPSTGFNSVNHMPSKNGNFLPFNQSHMDGVIEYNDSGNNRRTAQYSYTDGNSVYHDNTAYNYYGTKVPVNYQLCSGSPKSKIDFWFGMTMQCDFKMTQDGTYNGKDIVFEFQGDDDVWVYLDGVLVLDIGGTHGAKVGSINFKTGVVNDPTGTTDLKTKYTNALADNNNQAIVYNGKTIDSSYIANNFVASTRAGENYTFKPGTEHRLDFFYMERAETLSYCELQFNLPKGAVAVEKEVDGLDSELSDPRDYTFQLQNDSGTQLYSAADAVNQTYSLEHADGTTESKALASDCTFKLKDGEKAYFEDLENSMAYKVVELNVPSDVTQTATKKLYDTTNQRYTDPVAYNGETLSVNTSSETLLTFKNTYTPTQITVTKQVQDSTGAVVNDPAATYNFGLHVFKNNANGSVTDYGTKKFSISGSEFINGAGSKTITGLPSGASYELWEYFPDDNVNSYEAPKFTDSASPGTTVTARLVETGSYPAANDVISGTVNDNTVTVVNKYLPPQTVTVTFKYYDRKKVSGEPANIDETETAYSKSVAVTSYTSAETGKIDFSNIITDLGATNLNNEISNVVDTYSVPTKQSTAVNAFKNKTYTWGESSEYASANITAAQATYHTNSKRQPILKVADQEKWVTYFQSGKEVDAENTSFTDDSKVTNITVWLYNEPRKFTVNTHVPDGSTATGKTIKYEAYYNQRIGSYYGDEEEEDEYKAYCDLYSIPKTEYDARGTVTGEEERYTTSGAAETFNDQDFSYWTDAASSGNILSTDRKYNYRVTQDLDLYANYGQEITKGVTSVGNGVDVFYDTSGAKKLRVNTILSPYGFRLGNVPDPGIKYAAAAYLIRTDSTVSTALTPEQLSTVRSRIEAELPNVTINNQRGTKSFTIEGIGTVSLSVSQLGDKYNLTNKNRMQFVGSYNAPNRNRYVLAFTALKYDNGIANNQENKWYVSGNYVTHELKP